MDFISTYLSFQSSYNSVLKAFNVLKLFVYNHVRILTETPLSLFHWIQFSTVFLACAQTKLNSAVFPPLFQVSSKIPSCALPCSVKIFQQMSN